MVGDFDKISDAFDFGEGDGVAGPEGAGGPTVEVQGRGGFPGAEDFWEREDFGGVGEGDGGQVEEGSLVGGAGGDGRAAGDFFGVQAGDGGGIFDEHRAALDGFAVSAGIGVETGGAENRQGAFRGGGHDAAENFRFFEFLAGFSLRNDEADGGEIGLEIPAVDSADRLAGFQKAREPGFAGFRAIHQANGVGAGVENDGNEPGVAIWVFPLQLGFQNLDAVGGGSEDLGGEDFPVGSGGSTERKKGGNECRPFAF